MPGRKYSAGNGYRYGFNGKENDKEVKGEGNQYDYGFRIYDPRLGRFLSVDPLFQSYPWYTPFQFAGNTPIQAIDLDGLEEWVVTRWYDKNNNITQIRIFTVVDNKNKSSHVNLHFKNKKGIELAAGKKVLYLHLQAGTDQVFSPPTTGSALNKEENQIYNSRKKTSRIGDENFWTLEPAYASYKTGEDGNLAEKYTEYNAFVQFKIPPPQDPEQHTPKQTPPPTPTPDATRMCSKCFHLDNGVHFKEGVKDIANWLNRNQDYNLEISVDGGGNSMIFMDDWNERPSRYDGLTYREHAQYRFKKLQEAVNKAGGDGSRLSLRLLKAEGSTIEYKPVKKN